MNAQQLKNAILQDAITGRLVPQDPNDEPASVLLDKIRKEKAKLVKEGKLKKKDLEEKPITKEEIPFEIPESWEWCRLKDVVLFLGGYAYESTSFIASSNYQVLRLGNVKNDSLLFDVKPVFITKELALATDKYKCKKGDILVTMTGTRKKRDYFFSVLVDNNERNLYVNQRVGCLRSIESKLSYWIAKVLKTETVLKAVFQYETGTANQGNLGAENILKTVIPLPPLSEQHRIVAKIEELLPKVEEYGKAQEALDKLNAELPERLKKSILQEAITGKLVPQDPNDEPASVLLDRIRKEKAKLVKEGKLKKKDLIETPIGKDEIPFEIPESWGVVRLGEITYNHGQKTPIEDFSYIDIGSIDNEHQKLNQIENIIKAKDAPSRARKIVKRGDVIYATVRPYLHNLCIIDRDFNKEPIASTGFAVLGCFEGVYNKFLFYYLLSPIFDAYANDGDNAKGMAYPAINDKKLYNGVVPLPPLAEQHRIVAKIEELLSKIDKLKTK